MERTAQYLIVIYTLTESDGAPVSSGRIARVLGRSPQATTEKLQRLAENGLVIYEPYTGVQLTKNGREQASDLYETHEVLCRFCRDVLMLGDYVEEALALAGNVSPAVARRLQRTILRTDHAPTMPERLVPDQDGDRSAGTDRST